MGGSIFRGVGYRLHFGLARVSINIIFLFNLYAFHHHCRVICLALSWCKIGRAGRNGHQIYLTDIWGGGFLSVAIKVTEISKIDFYNLY